MKKSFLSFVFASLLLSTSVLAHEHPALRMIAPGEKLTWEILKDVVFKKWYPQESIYMLYPTFGASIKN
jgi:hypothetical protein